jgi:hypothetical protein
MNGCVILPKGDMAADSNTVVDSVDYNKCETISMLEVEILTKSLIRDALDEYDLMFCDIFCEGNSDLSNFTRKPCCNMQKVLNEADGTVNSANVEVGVDRSTVELQADTLFRDTASGGMHFDCRQHRKTQSLSVEMLCCPFVNASKASNVSQSIKSETSQCTVESVNEANSPAVYDPPKGSHDVATVFEKAGDLHGVVLHNEVDNGKSEPPVTSAFQLNDSSLTYEACNPSAENASSSVMPEFDYTPTECRKMIVFADDNNNQMLSAQSPSFRQYERNQFRPNFAFDVQQKIRRNSRSSNFKVTMNLMQLFN